MTWQTGEFSSRTWEAVADARRRIDELPLLRQLADGSLEPHRFAEYLGQDDFYLRGYARALAMLATRAPQAETAQFWASSAAQAVAAEVELHAGMLSDPVLAGQPRPQHPSPTTRGYVNFIQTSVAYEPYEVGVAAVLPCYWVYADVGLTLARRASVVADHPFGAWVAAYADEGFQDVTRQAIGWLDAAADGATDQVREAMVDAFATATRYEELFWERSYELEAWSF